MLARGFYARQDTVTPVLAAVAAVAINCTLAVVLVGPFGLPGIALAIAVAAWIEALALLVILRPARCRTSSSRAGRGRARGDRRQRRWPAAVAFLASDSLADALGRRPGPARPRRRIVLVGLVFGLVYAARLARVADPRTAVYRRGHGRRAPPPRQVVTAATPTAWDAFVEASDPGSYLQLTGWAAVKAVNGWTAHRIEAGGRPGAGRGPDPRPPAAADAVGLRLRAARAGRQRLDARRDRRLYGGRPRATAARAPAGSATCASTPRSRPTDRSTPTARFAGALRDAGWRPAAADPAERDPGHRPARRTRTRSGATCARSGASTSTRHGPRASRSSTRTATASASSTGSTARPPIGPAS